LTGRFWWILLRFGFQDGQTTAGPFLSSYLIWFTSWLALVSMCLVEFRGEVANFLGLGEAGLSAGADAVSSSFLIFHL
jgi:hypothetical protein